MEVNGKNIFKNATALSSRMVLVTIVGIYTFRVVLKGLGVENYGIYTVVAGLIGTVTFLNTSMAGATYRFISFALGQNDKQKAGKVFSAALICHAIIAAIIIVLAETLGLWFLNAKFNLPTESMHVANIIYQLSILSAVVGLTQVPYMATIIAYENMGVYAYLETANAVLKLAIAAFILYLPSNRLTVYAGMMTAVSVIIALIYRIYCIRKYSMARFNKEVDREICGDLLSYFLTLTSI